VRHLGVRGQSGWRELTDGGFASTLFAGDHFYLHDQRDQLIDALLPELRRVS
jgi:surfactin synthase thioesterase subunit